MCIGSAGGVEDKMVVVVKREKGRGKGRRRDGDGGGGGGGGEDEEGEGGEGGEGAGGGSQQHRVKDDLSDRRVLRSRYRELKSAVNGMRGTLAQADSREFKEIVAKAEQLHKRVSKPREQMADADMMIGITSELWDVAKSARTRTGTTAAEFVGALIQSYGKPGESAGAAPRMDWGALGLQAAAIFRHAPGMATMVGPMDVEPKARKPRESRTRDRPAERTRPSAVQEADPDLPCSETDANMKTMFQAMIERQEVELAHLVLNRSSFAQTVENLFALSFLVKDGRAEIKFSDAGVQSVVPRNAPSHSDRASGAVVNTQFIFRLDFSCWELMRTTVPAGAEVMPHRRPAGEPAQSQRPSTARPEPQSQSDRTPVRKFLRNRARETPASWADGADGDNAEEEAARRRKRKLDSGDGEDEASRRRKQKLEVSG